MSSRKKVDSRLRGNDRCGMILDGEARNLSLPFTVGYARNFALEPKEFRDRSFSPSGGRTLQSDKLTDSSLGFRTGRPGAPRGSEAMHNSRLAVQN
jgi:hypothetical protein